jgi:hypothetical protein
MAKKYRISYAIVFGSLVEKRFEGFGFREHRC